MPIEPIPSKCVPKSYKNIHVLFAVTLIGCAEQVRLPDRIEIPISVPCLDKVPERPSLASDAEILKQTDYAVVLSLWLDRRLRQDYEAVLEAALSGCVK
jgi:hypothetical protein